MPASLAASDRVRKEGQQSCPLPTRWQKEGGMDCGLFLEFSCRDGMTEHDAFAECFALVDEAEARGVDSVWLAEYHFSSFSVLSSPITIASAIAARTRRIRVGTAVVL